MLFFRDQPLDPAQQLHLAACFGEPAPYPLIQGLADYPLIVPVQKLPEEETNFGGVWHSDTAYLKTPAMGAILAARELPPAGGDTLFSNMYLAYETLPGAMKKKLEALNGVNESAKAAIASTRSSGAKNMSRLNRSAEHPVIRTHPETGRKLLYVNEAHTTRFAGMSVEQSTPLLDKLFRHQQKDEFTCRLHWQPDSVAFWDNRACQHYPLNDYPGHKRLMHRVSIGGDVPF